MQGLPSSPPAEAGLRSDEGRPTFSAGPDALEVRGSASLPMYNLPEMRSDNQALWDAIRSELHDRGIDLGRVPLDFERRPVPQSIEPETVFTQVCGYPLHTIYRGQAVILGAPVYTAGYCEGASHVGVVLVHADSRFESIEELRGCRFLFNSIHSNSGMNLPRRLFAPLARGERFFGSIAETHTQPGNIESIARGEADATCVDCVTYAFFCRHRPALGALTRVLAITPPSPSIPFVTAVTTPDAVVAALKEALRAVAQKQEWAAVRSGLLLQNIIDIDSSAYAIQAAYEREAAELGYRQLQ